jgi:hypothetical protein
MTEKRISRYKSLLIIYGLYILFWIIFIPTVKSPIFPNFTDAALSRFIPAQDIVLELAIIFLIILPLSSTFSLLIGGYFFTPIVLVIHKAFFRKKMFYGIQYESNLEEGRFLSLGFYPVLMAINFAYIFNNPQTWGFLLESNLVDEIDIVLGIPSLTRFLGMTILLMFTYGISIFLFSPVWYLRDSGIIYTNKKKVENSEEYFTIKSLGDWFQTLLKSYAGIGAILTYIFIVYFIISTFISPWDLAVVALWFGLPLFLLLSLIPALICNDLIRNHRINFTRKLSNKMGITDKTLISFEFKKFDK